MPSFKMKFSGVTILQGVEVSIFPIDFEWALQQCSATALPVMELPSMINSSISSTNGTLACNDTFVGVVCIRHRQLTPFGYIRELCVGYDKLPVSPISVPPQAVDIIISSVHFKQQDLYSLPSKKLD